MNKLVPEGWSVKKVVEFTEEHKQGYYTKNPYSEKGAYLIRITDLNNPKIDYSDMPMLVVDEKEYDQFKVKVGDFLFARSGAIGRYGIVSKSYRSVFASYLIRFRFDESLVSTRYFGYAYESDICQSQLAAITQGSSNININADNIKSLSVQFPPLPEQKKIAAILTSVDDVIEKTQAQIDKLKDLKTGMMQELLTRGVGVDGKPHTEFKDSPVGRIPKGWDVVTTGSIAKSIVPGRNKPKQMNGNIPWLTIADLGDVYVDKSKSRRGVTREVLSEAKGKTLPKNTVIMSVVGEFGLSSIAARELVINQQLHGFVCGNKVDPTFLCLSLRYHKDQMEKLATQTTIAYMNKDNAESVVLALPSLSEQRKIASVIISIEEKVKSVSKTLHAKTLVKKALMQDLLIGRVRVKVED